MPYKDKEKAKEYQRKYFIENKERMKAAHKLYVENNREKVREHNTEYMRNHRNKLKIIAFNILGNMCSMCGNTDMRCLQLDHVLGGGSKELKNKGRRTMYNFIIHNPSQKKYQLLCASCNVQKKYDNKEVIRNYRKYRYERREQIISLLGNSCNSCGNTNLNILEIHHIKNDGKKEREKYNTPDKYYDNIKEELLNKTASLELLCPNCHWIKRAENGI